jgi:hypothetical protein
VTAILGRDAITAAGVAGLIAGDWSGLRSQFDEWTAAAQEQAITTALRIAGVPAESDAARQARASMDAGRARAWQTLSGAMTSLANTLLYDPHPDASANPWGDLNPNSLVPTGMIRAALGVAGGNDYAAGTTAGSTISVGQPVGQIGTGATISNLITSAGGEREAYQWEHGPAINGFEPHEDLDGVEFGSFDDEALANPGDYPANAYLFPGDHDGCSCDFTALWVTADNSAGDG